MKNRGIEIFKQVVIPIISLVLSFVFWFLPYWGSQPLIFSLAPAEKLLLSLLSFVVITLFRIAWIEADNLKLQKIEHEQLEIIHEVEGEILNSRKFYRDVFAMRYGINDVFVKQCIVKIKNVTEEIRTAAENKNLRVEHDHLFMVKDVLDIYKNDDECVWRYSWPIYSDKRLFQHDAWRQYFAETAIMLRKRQLKEIHILLIIKDSTTLQNPRISKLLDYFRTNKRNVCRIILEERFKRICSQNSIPDKNWIDFGIYAKKLLFISDVDASGNGMFTKSMSLIDKYCAIFDTIWDCNNKLADVNPSNNETKVSIEELFRFDEEYFQPEDGNIFNNQPNH